MNLNLTSIIKNPLRDSVFRTLEEAIINLEIEPGDRLIETEISELLGVSRGPVREAIRELEVNGLIEHIPFKGAVVSTLTDNDVEELKICRMSVEILAAKIVINDEQKKNEIIKNFNLIIEKMTEANHEKNLSKFLSLDYQFHETLVTNADNTLLKEMWKPISVRLRRYFYLNSRKGYIPLDESLKQHLEIMDAIKEGDYEKTNELLQKHKCWS